MCHSRHRARAYYVHDICDEAGDRVHARRGDEPIVPEPHDLRASDAERDRAVEALRAHAAAGRLDAEELEERLGRALSAATRADLAALFADLPGLPGLDRGRPSAAPRRATHHDRDPLRFLPIAVLLVAIWALTGAGYFWPIWPLLWFAFVTLMWHRPGNTRVIGNRYHTR